MPSLDRRIVVRRTETRFNEYGEPTTTKTDFPVWATRIDRSQEDIEQAGGQIDQPARAYRLRWRREIAEAATSELSVIDSTLTLNATNVVEQTERGQRRRFITIEATGEELV